MKTVETLPHVTLVGAGPGDPDLITRKGIKALQQADAVLYDALVNPEILAEAPAGVPRIYVGKRAGQHSFKQEEINQLIVDHALAYGHVVRLKGGDSFVFGRGQEEVEFARERGIETTVVPGISSSIAVPSGQGIPLTRRGLNESFWVLTGTTRFGTLSDDVQLAARSSATAVILMGMNKIADIMEIFRREGKGNTPVAVIQNGSRPDERYGLGTVNTIESVVTEKGLGAPAIILVGEVVSLHPDLRHAAENPQWKNVESTLQTVWVA